MAIGNIFNEAWYLKNYPDVAAAVAAGIINAHEHYEQYGRFEGRSPSPVFDPVHYLTQHPDVAAAVEAGLTTAYDHFLNFGATEGRSSVAYFDPVFYLQNNPDIAEAVAQGLVSATEHFLLYGQSEPRAISPFFDLGAYMRANPDVADAAQAGFMNPLEHLLVHGVSEGRDLGNGVSLAQFQNDPVFQQAIASGGNPLDALARIEEVAPFIPTFQPPAGWTPPANTPIPTDFVPVEGQKLIIPPSVTVPDDIDLPEDVFEPADPTPQPEPEPDPQPDPTPGPVRSFKATLDSEGVISFKSTNLSGDVSVTLTESGDNYIATFTRGTKDSAVTISKDDLPNVRLDWAEIGIANFKPGAGTVLIRNPGEGDGTKGALAATIQDGVDASAVDGTVLVGAGTYTEEVVINKQGIQLLGPNAGINPNDGARTNEAVLRPERASETGVQYVVTFTSEANDGVLDGFALQGDHNNGVYTQSMQSGISVESDGTKIVNNIVDDFNYLGVRVNNFTYNADSAKWAIHLVRDVEVANNKISNVLLEPDNSDSVGHAIYYQGALGTIHGNTILNSETGIQVQPYGKNYNPALYEGYEGEIPVVYDNTIEAAYRGIWLNYAQDDAPQWEIRGNTITATDGRVAQADWQGIWVQTFEGGNGFDVHGNTIDGVSATVPAYGVRFTGIKGNPERLTFNNNEINGVDADFYNVSGGVLTLSDNGEVELFSNIKSAVEASDGSDTIYVGPGVFQEDILINRDDVKIVLSSSSTLDGGFVVSPGVEGFHLSGGGKIINGLSTDVVPHSAAKGIYLRGSANVEVDGIILEFITNEKGQPRGIEAEVGDSVIQVTGAQFVGGWASGIYLNSGNDLQVEDSAFKGATVGIGTDGPARLMAKNNSFEELVEGVGLTKDKVIEEVQVVNNQFQSVEKKIANGGADTGLEELQGTFVVVVASGQGVQTAIEAFYTFDRGTPDVDEIGQIILGPGDFDGPIKINGNLMLIGQGDTSVVQGSIRINDPSDANKVVSNIWLEDLKVDPVGSGVIPIIALSNYDTIYNTENLFITNVIAVADAQHGIGLFDVDGVIITDVAIVFEGETGGNSFYAIEALGIKDGVLQGISAEGFANGTFGALNIWRTEGYQANENIALINVAGADDQTVEYWPLG